MHLSTIVMSLSIATFLVACTHAEPSLVPLGHGPLSRQEREVAARVAAAQRPSRSKQLASSTAQEPTPGDPSTVASTGPSDDHPAPRAVATIHADAGALGPSTTNESEQSQKTVDDWLGLYRGDDTTTFKVPDQPDRRFDDSNAKIRVERSSSTQVDFALVDSSNDKDICKLSAVVEGDTATLDAGQTCFLDPEESMTVKSRPGKATRKANRLTLDLVLDTQLDGELGLEEGSIEYHFEGQR